MKILYAFIFSLLVGISYTSYGQEIHVKGMDMPSILFINDLSQTNISSSDGLSQLLLSAFNEGFYTASLDSINPQLYLFQLGPKLNAIPVHYHADSNAYALLQNAPQIQVLKQPAGDILTTHEKIIDFFENVGFPFAKITRKETAKNDSLIFLIQSGPMVLWDTAVYKGNFKIAPKYLKQLFNSPIGEVYKEVTFKKMTTNRSQDIRFIKAPEILFIKNKARPYFYIEEKKNSTIGGLIGFNGNGKTFVFTGNVDLHLQNSFHRLETFDLNWEAFQNKSQNLSSRLSIPYLLGSKFGYLLELQIFKQDSSFLNSSFHNQISYIINPAFSVASGLNFQNSNNIDAPDINKKLYSISFDYKNQSKTLEAFSLSYLGGQRKSEDLEEYQDQVLLKFALNIPVYRWIAFHIESETKHIESKELVESELFRLGGFKSLRGFNELSLYANSFSYLRNELRFALEQESFVFAFTDLGYLNRLGLEQQLLGFGAGLQLKSNNGIFSIAYGLGKFAGSTVDLKTSKIHFGFVSQF